MKTRTLVHALATLACTLFALPAFSQTDGTWTQTASGSHDWSDTANWGGGNIAYGAGATASFTVNPAGAQTVSLNTAVILGNLVLNRNHNLTLVGPESLTLDVPSGTPLISTLANRIIRIESVIAGSDGLEITGGGTGGGVVLRGANTFTGGIHLNAGSLGINQNFSNTAGLNNNQITVSGTSFAAFDGGTTINGGVHIDEGSEFKAGTNNSTLHITGALTGSGTLDHQVYGAGNQAITITDGSAFTGNLDYSKLRSATTRVNSLGDSGRIRFGLLNFGGIFNRQHVFEFGSGATADLVFNTRQFEIEGSSARTDYSDSFEIRSNNANHALIINTDLINNHTGTVPFRFMGSGTQANTFAGNITDGPEGTVLNIEKLNAGRWILAGHNTYTGLTTVSGGTLALQGDWSLPHESTLNIAGGRVDIYDRARVADLQYAGGAFLEHGTYGSTASSAENQNDDRFSGTGVLYVGVPFPPTVTMIIVR